MKDARPIPLKCQTFYRDCPVAAYAIYGTGPLYGRNSGARYSPPKAFPVIYLSADRLLAQLETTHHLNRAQPEDPREEIQEIHRALSSYDTERLLSILRDMADSEEGYVENEEISKYLINQKVKALFEEDPARLQVFLEMGPHLGTPLRCATDASRISLSVNVTARGVLDLTDNETLLVLGVCAEDLLQPTDVWQNSSCDGMPLTQRLGLAAWDAPGIDGMLVPTALPEKSLSDLVRNPVNLVLFMHEAEPHRPRSRKVTLDTEEEFVKLTNLFWVHRPKWLIDAIERHNPHAAAVLKNVGDQPSPR